MYLSIGNDMAVREHSIIGIFDLDNTTTSKRTREFLEQCEKEGQVVPCDDLPKSFLLTDEYRLPKVYLTSLNIQTLTARLGGKGYDFFPRPNWARFFCVRGGRRMRYKKL